MALASVHYNMLRAIHRRFPRAYEDIFVRDDFCESLEDLVVLHELADAGLIWMTGHGGKDWMQALWTITRTGAETAARRPPARARAMAEPESTDEAGPATNVRAGGQR